MTRNEELPADLRESMVSTGDVRLHVVEAGPADGPLVILLHGFPEFWYGWRRQIGPLAAAGYRVLAPDQRGYNTSDKPGRVRDYGIDLLARDVVGLIDACGRQRCSLVGHDWGAAVGWWTAIRYPQRLDRLAILNVPHPIVMRRQLRRSMSQLRKSWYMFFFQLPWLPEKLLSLRRYRSALDGLRGTSRPGSFTDADLLQYVDAWSQPGAMTTMIHWYRAMLRVPPGKLESIRVRVPTQIIWGARDRFLGADMVEPSAALCDNVRAHFLEEATHWVQHDEFQQVNDLLLHFLAERFEELPVEHC
jgi:pimeloyl-ACP methyl ester carboxylesterase